MGLQQPAIDDGARHRGDADNRAAAPREHRTCLDTAGLKDAGEIDVEHPLPLRERHRLGRRRIGDAGAVDRGRERSKFRLHTSDGGREIVLARHVAADRDRTLAERLDLRDSLCSTGTL